MHRILPYFDEKVGSAVEGHMLLQAKSAPVRNSVKNVFSYIFHRRGSRRGSFIDMTGIDVDADQDQESINEAIKKAFELLSNISKFDKKTLEAPWNVKPESQSPPLLQQSH